MGIFDTTEKEIIYNSTDFKRNPCGVLDKVDLKLYPANLKTLIHLGAN
jgi:hypothetical protein